MKCHHCGTINRDGAARCGECYGSLLIPTTIAALREAKRRHIERRQCEWPRTCGACHWYSGGIEALKSIINETGIEEDLTPLKQSVREQIDAEHVVGGILEKEDADRIDEAALRALVGRAAGADGVPEKPREHSGANSGNASSSVAAPGGKDTDVR